MSEEERGSKRDIIVSKHIKQNTHTNRKRSDWLFIIANWQSHENFVFVFVLWHAFYILFAFASGFWEFSEITQTSLHTDIAYEMICFIGCDAERFMFCFCCLFFFDAFCYVFSVDGGHQFPEGMQYRFKWQKRKIPSSAFVYISTPSKQTRKKTKQKINKYYNLWHFSRLLNFRKIKCDKEFHPNYD